MGSSVEASVTRPVTVPPCCAPRLGTTSTKAVTKAPNALSTLKRNRVCIAPPNLKLLHQVISIDHRNSDYSFSIVNKASEVDPVNHFSNKLFCGFSGSGPSRPLYIETGERAADDGVTVRPKSPALSPKVTVLL